MDFGLKSSMDFGLNIFFERSLCHGIEYGLTNHCVKFELKTIRITFFTWSKVTFPEIAISGFLLCDSAFCCTGLQTIKGKVLDIFP